MIVRLTPGMACPIQTFVCGIDEEYDGREFYYFVLRLSSYQFMRHPWRRSPSWQQLAFTFHGSRGFEFLWVDCERKILS